MLNVAQVYSILSMYGIFADTYHQHQPFFEGKCTRPMEILENQQSHLGKVLVTIIVPQQKIHEWLIFMVKSINKKKPMDPMVTDSYLLNGGS